MIFQLQNGLLQLEETYNDHLVQELDFSTDQNPQRNKKKPSKPLLAKKQHFLAICINSCLPLKIIFLCLPSRNNSKMSENVKSF